MRRVLELAGELRKDENGASLVEYTMLLAIIVLAVIVTHHNVGHWVNNTWTGFYSALNAAPTP